MKPAQAYCKRCGDLFCYFMQCARRVYCSPCVELERLDLLQFSKMQRRKNAVARARADRSIKPSLYRDLRTVAATTRG